MPIKQKLEKILVKFGENNSPAFVAMSIAAAKGIFRPAFTMADKKESYETKRYTAIREGLTELIAIPIYYLSGVASSFVSKKLVVPKNFVAKEVYKKYSSGDTSEEVLTAIKKAENLAKTNLPKVQTTTSFIGVALSALLLIPLMCSVSIKPIMKKIEQNDKTSKSNDIVTKPNSSNTNNKTDYVTFKSLYPQNMSGMKVGGL